MRVIQLTTVQSSRFRVLQVHTRHQDTLPSYIHLLTGLLVEAYSYEPIIQRLDQYRHQPRSKCNPVQFACACVCVYVYDDTSSITTNCPCVHWFGQKWHPHPLESMSIIITNNINITTTIDRLTIE